MSRRDDDFDLVAALIAGGAAGEVPLERLLARSWPGGAGDRLDPTAAQWVRRWDPRSGGAAASLVACDCARGRCAACN